jgi:hypothetical protein
MTSEFVKCSCGTEAIEVARFDDEPDVYLSLWYYGGSEGKLPWSQRVKLCWRVLTRGRGHPDHVVLDDVGRQDLVRALGPTTPIAN